LINTSCSIDLISAVAVIILADVWLNHNGMDANIKSFAGQR